MLVLHVTFVHIFLSFAIFLHGGNYNFQELQCILHRKNYSAQPNVGFNVVVAKPEGVAGWFRRHVTKTYTPKKECQCFL
jgi:hypothetical protein